MFGLVELLEFIPSLVVVFKIDFVVDSIFVACQISYYVEAT